MWFYGVFFWKLNWYDYIRLKWVKLHCWLNYYFAIVSGHYLRPPLSLITPRSNICSAHFPCSCRPRELEWEKVSSSLIIAFRLGDFRRYLWIWAPTPYNSDLGKDFTFSLMYLRLFLHGSWASRELSHVLV